MGAKHTKSEVRPSPRKLDIYNTYTKATDSSTESLQATPREKARVVGRASRRASKIDIQQAPNRRSSIRFNHNNRIKAINVQKATKRNALTFSELSDQRKQHAVLASLDRISYGRRKSIRFSDEKGLKRQFTAQTQTLLRKQTTEVSVDHKVEFETEPLHQEIYKDIRPTKPVYVSTVKSTYKLIKPRQNSTEQGVVETSPSAMRKGDPNVMSLLREAAVTHYEPESSTRRTCTDLRAVLSPNSPRMNPIFGSPLANPLYSTNFTQEVEKGKYRIKSNNAPQRKQESADKREKMKSRAEKEWTWKGSLGVNSRRV